MFFLFLDFVFNFLQIFLYQYLEAEVLLIFIQQLVS